jgi:hypothetical protein
MYMMSNNKLTNILLILWITWYQYSFKALSQTDHSHLDWFALELQVSAEINSITHLHNLNWIDDQNK